jgi:hypothetical protein
LFSERERERERANTCGSCTVAVAVCSVASSLPFPAAESNHTISLIQSEDEEVDEEVVRRALGAAREAVTEATIMSGQAQGRPLHFELVHPIERSSRQR